MTTERPLLLPQPKMLSLNSGTFDLPPADVIIDISDPSQLFTAQRLKAAVARIGRSYTIAVGESTGETHIILDINPDKAGDPQGYSLEINPGGIYISSVSAAGVFYGVCTLIQLIEQYGASLPCLEITDTPDFPARGVMLDISRDKVPTMDTLYRLIDMFAGFKINQLQLYTEHTFAYRAHRVVWEDASPITPEEILLLDAYCRERFIELVPNQNSFGHMHHWFEHPQYLPMAETQTSVLKWHAHPFTIAPLDPNAIP
ncbi:MAG: family 20 glycosylhydrolase, partial [Blastochloris sp.]|nr:family 20 glycosylhydrolase [Blastochloris sp.]